ncbi:MAG: polysaccharide biosynthesis/export family protein [candidate division KSB1 bacterium]|nr:polysaccharide biosynthesis/export family protein [candidate division KSB1 bacterium]
MFINEMSKIITSLLILVVVGFGQIPGVSSNMDIEEEEKRSGPTAIDFSKMFEVETVNREEFLQKQRQRQLMLQQQAVPAAVLERAINPQSYKVGPGDVFDFNVWGALEAHYTVYISPEGFLSIPTVGEINISELTLAEAQDSVFSIAKPAYDNCQISLSLVTPRQFRVHVTGEVRYPGTFTAVAMDRVSELIIRAGGMTDMAWKAGVRIIRDSDTLHINLDRFEQEGDLENNPYVESGDVIVAPAMDLVGKATIRLEGDVEIAGTYQTYPDEPLKDFLQRVGADKPNVEYTRIVIKRETGKKNTFHPFQNDSIFYLKPNDRVILPSNYVYIRGEVDQQGAFNYVRNLTARDYVIMAGANGRMNGVWVLHKDTGKKERGPETPVYPGDMVHMPRTFEQYFQGYFGIVSTLSSLLISAIAVGVIGN